jgi:hypothetical protein
MTFSKVTISTTIKKRNNTAFSVIMPSVVMLSAAIFYAEFRFAQCHNALNVLVLLKVDFTRIVLLAVFLSKATRTIWTFRHWKSADNGSTGAVSRSTDSTSSICALKLAFSMHKSWLVFSNRIFLFSYQTVQLF